MPNLHSLLEQRLGVQLGEKVPVRSGAGLHSLPSSTKQILRAENLVGVFKEQVRRRIRLKSVLNLCGIPLLAEFPYWRIRYYGIPLYLIPAVQANASKDVVEAKYLDDTRLTLPNGSGSASLAEGI